MTSGSGVDFTVDDLLKGIGCMRTGDDKATSSEVLSFLDQQLKLNTKESAEIVAEQIRSQSIIRVLELRGNTLGIEAGERIAESLLRHPELEKCLWSDLFTGRLKTEIPCILKSLCSAMIRANCHITELDLSDNAFGPIGAEGIQEFLTSPAAFSLEVLKLNNNGLGAGGRVIASCLSECYDKSILAGRPLRLKTFIAGRNRLEVPGATALAMAFKKIGSLEELVLHQNGITAKGIEALADCLVSNPNLRIVNFNDNTATQIGSVALASAIKVLSNLETINFGDCLCRDQGCHAIIDSLSPLIHKKLKVVDLSGAELSGEAALQIIHKWNRFPNAHLVLSSNNYGGMFGEVRDTVRNINVDIGDSDDDQGSLSDEGEELMSDPDSEEDVSSDDDQPVHRVNQLIDELKNWQVPVNSQESKLSMGEDAARKILELCRIISRSKGNKNVTDTAINVAESVVVREESICRRPIPSTTQLLNHILAQAGFVKAEEKWGINVDRNSLYILLQALLRKGLFSTERETIQYYFNQDARTG